MDVNSINFLLLLNILMLSCGCNAVNMRISSIIIVLGGWKVNG